MATLVPHLYPVGAPGFRPTRSERVCREPGLAAPCGAPRRAARQGGLRQGRAELNDDAGQARAAAGVQRLHGGLSEQLCWSERSRSSSIRAAGRAGRPRRRAADVGAAVRRGRPPAGGRAARAGRPVDRPGSRPPAAPRRAGRPGRSSRSACSPPGTAGRCADPPVSVPDNARLVEWVSYAKTMPRCALVICHAGHGTMARALACGCPVLGGPPRRRHGRERRPRGLGRGRRQAALAASDSGGATPGGATGAVGRLAADRARELAAWAARHDGAVQAAHLGRGARAGQSGRGRARTNSISSGASQRRRPSARPSSCTARPRPARRSPRALARPRREAPSPSVRRSSDPDRMSGSRPGGGQLRGWDSNPQHFG